MAYGVFNNRDQAEEALRDWQEGEQTKKQAQLTALAVSSALQPQGQREDTTPEQQRLHKGSASNVVSQATAPVPAEGKRRNCLPHVQTVESQAIRRENVPCPIWTKGFRNSKW